MKLSLSTILVLVSYLALSQSYTYKPTPTPAYDPSPLIDKHNTTPQSSTPRSTIVHPQTTATIEENNHSISITNMWREAKDVDLFVRNKSNYEWEYLKTIRVPDGRTITIEIGMNEYYYNYGYLVKGSIITTVSSFTTRSINLF